MKRLLNAFGMAPLQLLFSLILFVATATPALAEPVNGSVALSPGRKIFFRTVTAKPGMPTLMLANGLIYDLRNWDDFIALCEARGYGVVQFAYSTQPESIRLLNGAYPDFLWPHGFELKDLSDEFLAVYRAAGVQGKVQLLTLSYGSIAAEFAIRHPELIERIIIASPLVVPVDRYNPEGARLHEGFELWQKYAKFWDPFQLWSQYIYDLTWRFVYGSALGSRMGSKAESDQNYVPEGLSSTLFKLSVFHMVRAARNFDLKDYATQAALPPVHLMIASGEDKPALDDQLAYWEKLPEAKQTSVTLFAPAYHALMGAHPRESFAWMDYLLSSKFTPQAGLAYLVQTGARPVAQSLTYVQLKELIKSIPGDEKAQKQLNQTGPISLPGIQGNTIPDDQFPGNSIPRNSSPGSSIPGRSSPGSSVPGKSTPGSSAPGISR